MSRARLALLQITCLTALLISLSGWPSAAAQSTPTIAPTATRAPTAAPSPAALSAPRIITPLPVQAEEPLTVGGSAVPSIFTGVTDYTPVQAQLASADVGSASAASFADATRAVVQIRRCDSFGCTTPVGSGVIIHPGGSIATAHHVLLTRAEDPTSPVYEDYLIALTTNTEAAPQPRFRAHPWGDEWDGSRLNYCDTNCAESWKDTAVDDGYQYTAPVGSYPDGASPFGALDMAGNVWEWVADFYDAEYYTNAPERNPPGPATGTGRVLRGGAFNFDRDLVRCAVRGRNPPDRRVYLLGFRVVSPGF